MQRKGHPGRGSGVFTGHFGVLRLLANLEPWNGWNIEFGLQPCDFHRVVRKGPPPERGPLSPYYSITE